MHCLLDPSSFFSVSFSVVLLYMTLYVNGCGLSTGGFLDLGSILHNIEGKLRTVLKV